MRVAAIIPAAALALSVAACGQDVLAPQPAEQSPAFLVTADQTTGPTNECYGEIIAGIASTWPWAHEDKVAFPPPPGSIALWVEVIGPVVGISSVRELQLLFCSST